VADVAMSSANKSIKQNIQLPAHCISIEIRVAPDFGFRLRQIQNPAIYPKSGSGQISSRIWSDLADAIAAAVRSVNCRYKLTKLTFQVMHSQF